MPPQNRFVPKREVRRCDTTAVPTLVWGVPTEIWRNRSQDHVFPEAHGASLANSLLKASSSIDADSGPEKARLDATETPWVAGEQHPGQWLEVSLPEEMTVTAVATQGRYNANQWVSYYKLMHKTKNWDWYGGGRWLRGNWDRSSVKKHEVKPFKAKYIRFYPKKWNEKIAMRVEVFACKEKKHAVPTDTVVKKLAAGVKDVVDARVNNATASAVQAVQAAVNMDNTKLTGLVSAVVQNATQAATTSIKKAAMTAVSNAVAQATEMATARIKHAAIHAVPAAKKAIEAAVNVTDHAQIAAKGAAEAVAGATEVDAEAPDDHAKTLDSDPL